MWTSLPCLFSAGYCVFTPPIIKPAWFAWLATKLRITASQMYPLNQLCAPRHDGRDGKKRGPVTTLSRRKNYCLQCQVSQQIWWGGWENLFKGSYFYCVDNLLYHLFILLSLTLSFSESSTILSFFLTRPLPILLCPESTHHFSALSTPCKHDDGGGDDDDDDLSSWQ